MRMPGLCGSRDRRRRRHGRERRLPPRQEGRHRRCPAREGNARERLDEQVRRRDPRAVRGRAQREDGAAVDGRVPGARPGQRDRVQAPRLPLHAHEGGRRRGLPERDRAAVAARRPLAADLPGRRQGDDPGTRDLRPARGRLLPDRRPRVARVGRAGLRRRRRHAGRHHPPGNVARADRRPRGQDRHDRDLRRPDPHADRHLHRRGLVAGRRQPGGTGHPGARRSSLDALHARGRRPAGGAPAHDRLRDRLLLPPRRRRPRLRRPGADDRGRCQPRHEPAPGPRRAADPVLLVGLLRDEPRPKCDRGRGLQPRRFLYATGFSGHGFQQAPAVGEHLAELILGEQPSLDLSPLTLDRFARGGERHERFVV